MNITDKILKLKNIKYEDKIKILALYDFLSDSKKEKINNIVNGEKKFIKEAEESFIKIEKLFIRYKKRLLVKIEEETKERF